MDDTTKRDDSDSEPGLTQRNSQTVISEDFLAEDPPEVETSTRAGDRAIPSSYGAGGGMTPETDEGGDGSEGYD